MDASNDMSPYGGSGGDSGGSWVFKIAGGASVAIERVPFQGYITNAHNNEIVCGATIISSLVILTAAHCFVNKAASSLTFVAGDKRRSTIEGTEQRINISQIYMYEGFDTGLTSPEHDIGFAVLSSRLTLNDYVKVAGVASAPTTYIGTGTISGYGKSHDNENIYHDEVQAAAVPLVSKTECNRHWNPRLNITNNYICAYKRGVEACSGDSGGGLSGYVNRELMVVGVIAAGQRCENNNAKPGLFINVSQYGSWLRNKIASVANCPSDRIQCSPYSTKCIPKTWICDGDNDCGDNEDEAKCKLHRKRSQCSRDQMWCQSSSKCIKNTWICDGDNDCGNNDDEANCKLFGKQAQCSQHQFWCKSSSKCITIDWVCDGDNDCGNNEDEKFCTFH